MLQPVLARQHQVEHDQVDRLAREHAVQRLGVLGQQHVEAFLGQVAAQQVADAGVVIDDVTHGPLGYSGWTTLHASELLTRPILGRFGHVPTRRLPPVTNLAFPHVACNKCLAGCQRRATQGR